MTEYLVVYPHHPQAAKQNTHAEPAMEIYPVDKHLLELVLPARPAKTESTKHRSKRGRVRAHAERRGKGQLCANSLPFDRQSTQELSFRGRVGDAIPIEVFREWRGVCGWVRA